MNRHESALALTSTVQCPICDGRFPQFLQSRRHQHSNSTCPGCGSKKRHRLQWLFLQNQTDFTRDHLRFLHFAPEACLLTRFSALPNLEYLTADIEPGRAMLEVDITAIAPSVGTFDAIVCSHVLEHIPDDRLAMREMYRVLNPGGWALVMVPIDADRASTFEDPTVVTPEARERIFQQHDHVRLYGLDVRERLEEAGFSVGVHRYAKELGSDAVRRYGLKRSDHIFFCLKSRTSRSSRP